MKRTVAALMTPDPETVSVHATAADARRVMSRRRVRHVPVVDDQGHLSGLISLTDIMQYMTNPTGEVQRDADPLDHVSVRQMMSHVLPAVPRWAVLSQAARKLLDEKLSCLPVVDEDFRVVGILTEADFVRVVAEMLEADEALEDEPTEVERRR